MTEIQRLLSAGNNEWLTSDVCLPIGLSVPSESGSYRQS